MIEDKKRMLQKFEKWNSIAAQVHVISKVGLGDPTAKQRCIDKCCSLPIETAQDTNPKPPQFLDLDSGDDCPQEPSSSTRIVPEEVTAHVLQLMSQLVAKEVIAKYQQANEKLRQDLYESSCDGDDAVWYLKSWDANGIRIVKIHCGKCQKDFGGNTRNHTNYAISNFFANIG